MTQPGEGGFNAHLNPGDTFSWTAAEPGTISYFCIFHGSPDGGMQAFVTVVAAGEDLPEPQPAPSTTFAALGQPADNVAAALAWTDRLVGSFQGDRVLLGRDDDFADLLGAGATGLPLFLTPTDALDPRTLSGIQALGASRVTIVGGPAAVSESVADDLRDAGLAVDRIEGWSSAVPPRSARPSSTRSPSSASR